MNNYWLGKKHTEETKKKIGRSISIALKGRKMPEEVKEKISESLKGRKLSEEHKKKMSENMKRMRMENPSRFFTPESFGLSGDRHRSWKGGISIGKNKLEYYRMKKAERKIKEMGVGGQHSLKQWNELKSKYGFMCLCCKKVEPEIRLTEDHIIPINIWNTWIKFHPEIKYLCNDIENIQPLCLSCNCKKFTKIVDYRNKVVSQES